MNTDCPKSDEQLATYFDGEMSASEALAFQTHLETCDVCKAVLANDERLRGVLRSEPLYHRAPADLLARLPSTIQEPGFEVAPKRPVSRSRWAIGIAATLAAAACLAVLVTVMQNQVGRDDLLAQEVVSSHIRALMANHLLDVPSLDRHTVKPWFDGKLDFAPPVLDTTARGFPLIGGRLDYISGRPVAALVYKRDQHIINLFIWTSAQVSDEPGRVMDRQGYNMVRWSRSGMTFWAVSDLELTQLQQFAQAQQAE